MARKGGHSGHTGHPRHSNRAGYSRSRGRDAAPLLIVVVLAVSVGVVAAVLLVGGLIGSDETGSPLPEPHLTATAEPAVPDEAEPITAASAPGTVAQEPAPVISVGPGFDSDLHSIADPASPWVIVNKTRPLDPQNWAPPQLDAVGGAQLVPEAASALGDLMDGAAEADSPIRPATAYRAYGFQEWIYHEYAVEFGEERTDTFSARPGFSEHQTGWAVDVFASAECRLKVCFADEPAGQWVAAHAHEYGFVLRYPKGQEAVTGFTFEPWHLRYVGIDLATYMHDAQVLTLEQAFELDPAPSYE